jgi:hypothetical protein
LRGWRTSRTWYAHGDDGFSLDAAFAQKTDLPSLAYGVLRINPENDIELDEAVRRSDDLMFKNKSERKEFRE